MSAPVVWSIIFVLPRAKLDTLPTLWREFRLKWYPIILNFIPQQGEPNKKDTKKVSFLFGVLTLGREPMLKQRFTLRVRSSRMVDYLRFTESKTRYSPYFVERISFKMIPNHFELHSPAGEPITEKVEHRFGFFCYTTSCVGRNPSIFKRFGSTFGAALIA